MRRVASVYGVLGAAGGGSSGGGGGGGIFVAGFVEAWGDFLDDAEFEEGAEVGDAASGDEEVLEGAGEGGGGRGGGGRGEGEACGEEEVFDVEVEGVHAVVADA